MASETANRYDYNIDINLRNECPIGFKQLRTFCTASKQLPDFISQRLWNSSTHKWSDLPWALADVLVPAFENIVPAVQEVFIGHVLAHNARAAQQWLIIV